MTCKLLYFDVLKSDPDKNAFTCTSTSEAIIKFSEPVQLSKIQILPPNFQNVNLQVENVKYQVVSKTANVRRLFDVFGARLRHYQSLGEGDKCNGSSTKTTATDNSWSRLGYICPLNKPILEVEKTNRIDSIMVRGSFDAATVLIFGKRQMLLNITKLRKDPENISPTQSLLNQKISQGLLKPIAVEESRQKKLISQENFKDNNCHEVLLRNIHVNILRFQKSPTFFTSNHRYF